MKRIVETSAILALAGLLLGATQAAAQEGIAIPAPTLDEAETSTKKETAVFAGGCFWGVQGVFQRVAGVSNAVPAMRAAARRRRITKRSAMATSAMPSRSASPSIPRKSAMASCCRFISRSPTIRPN